MKRKSYLLIMALIASVCVAGCTAKTGENTSTNPEFQDPETYDESLEDDETKEETEDEEFVGMANPWTDVSADELFAATGVEANVPENAENVVYRYLEAENLGEIQFKVNSADYNFRMQPTAEFTDISGLFYEWTGEEDSKVSICDAKLYEAVDGANTVRSLLWYDTVPGVMYSLSEISEGAEADAIVQIAETVYVPSQQEVSGDLDADAQAEIEEYFLGSFMTENEEVDLTISDNGDGTYGVRFGIFRLCSMDEGVGTYDEHKISFTTIDPSGEPMEGVIYRDSENSLTLKITNSTWGYIESDTEYPGLFRV